MTVNQILIPFSRENSPNPNYSKTVGEDSQDDESVAGGIKCREDQRLLLETGKAYTVYMALGKMFCKRSTVL